MTLPQRDLEVKNAQQYEEIKRLEARVRVLEDLVRRYMGLADFDQDEKDIIDTEARMFLD